MVSSCLKSSNHPEEKKAFSPKSLTNVWAKKNIWKNTKPREKKRNRLHFWCNVGRSRHERGRYIYLFVLLHATLQMPQFIITHFWLLLKPSRGNFDEISFAMTFFCSILHGDSSLYDGTPSQGCIQQIKQSRHGEKIAVTAAVSWKKATCYFFLTLDLLNFFFRFPTKPKCLQ